MKGKRIVFGILMFLPLAVVLVALPFLPDQIPAHYGFDNQVTRWGSKYEALLLPILTIVLGLFLLAMARYAAKHEESGKNNENVCLITGILRFVHADNRKCHAEAADEFHDRLADFLEHEERADLEKESAVRRHLLCNQRNPYDPGKPYDQRTLLLYALHGNSGHLPDCRRHLYQANREEIRKKWKSKNLENHIDISIVEQL